MLGLSLAGQAAAGAGEQGRDDNTANNDRVPNLYEEKKIIGKQNTKR